MDIQVLKGLEAGVQRCSVKNYYENALKFDLKHLWWGLYLVKLQSAEGLRLY